ncbi:hypothetical protein BDP27DRAFT_1340249 [Rhodocollybia butyracea]|uniref:Uncharacterized protein n=1 Tax=Rhodocollybia butyracea TaxID=206335 RepID=A0A9P5PAS9_9AGAR|nr:hypothetical protein BDP27DRAFT_1340249 [Rhodocollybia butyracea]
MDGRGNPNRSPNRWQYQSSGAPTGSNTGYPNPAGAPNALGNGQQQPYPQAGAGRGAPGHGYNPSGAPTGSNTGFFNPAGAPSAPWATTAYGQQPSYTGAGRGAPGHGYNPSGAPTGSNTGYPNSAAPTTPGQQPPYTGGGAQDSAPPFNLPQVRWPSHAQHQGNSQQHTNRVPAGAAGWAIERRVNIWRAGDSPRDFGGRPTTSNAAYNPQRYYGGTTNAGAQPFGAATPAQGYGVDIPASRHAEPYHSNQALREAGGHIPPHVRSNAAANPNAYPVGHQSPRSDARSTGSDPNMYPVGHLSLGSAHSSASVEHSGSAHSSASVEHSGSTHSSASVEHSGSGQLSASVAASGSKPLSDGFYYCPNCGLPRMVSDRNKHICDPKKDSDNSKDKGGGNKGGGNSSKGKGKQKA